MMTDASACLAFNLSVALRDLDLDLELDLLTPKVDRFVSLACEPFMPIGIKIGSLTHF